MSPRCSSTSPITRASRRWDRLGTRLTRTPPHPTTTSTARRTNERVEPPAFSNWRAGGDTRLTGKDRNVADGTRVAASTRDVNGTRAWLRVSEDLIRAFGDQQVFRDVEAIEAGAHFQRPLFDALRAATVLLLLIRPP